jgi:hypothetical protein
MVALHSTHLVPVSMRDAVQVKRVAPEGDMVRMARELGIVFG